MTKHITIIGAGLAGAEAALCLAARGWHIKLYEMRPQRMTPAHTTDQPAELVCSNSLKSLRLDTAAGLLKAELERLGSVLLPLAHQAAVPAGQALAVDRDKFSALVAQAIANEPSIELIRSESPRFPMNSVSLQPPFEFRCHNALG
jgi:methylenetetrahydrofolate--tRNA-(uracil-5-)-methyltransferase